MSRTVVELYGGERGEGGLVREDENVFKGKKMERRRDKTERITIQPEHYADIYFSEVIIFLETCLCYT